MPPRVMVKDGMRGRRLARLLSRSFATPMRGFTKLPWTGEKSALFIQPTLEIQLHQLQETDVASLGLDAQALSRMNDFTAPELSHVR